MSNETLITSHKKYLYSALSFYLTHPHKSLSMPIKISISMDFNLSGMSESELTMQAGRP
jgi:hypothetical protein